MGADSGWRCRWAREQEADGGHSCVLQNILIWTCERTLATAQTALQYSSRNVGNVGWAGPGRRFPVPDVSSRRGNAPLTPVVLSRLSWPRPEDLVTSSEVFRT